MLILITKRQMSGKEGEEYLGDAQHKQRCGDTHSAQAAPLDYKMPYLVMD